MADWTTEREEGALKWCAQTECGWCDRPWHECICTTATQGPAPIELHQAIAELQRLRADRDRLDKLINNPHTDDFLEAVRIEAAHQRERWPENHDADKAPEDWFWLIGYVAGKAIRPGTPKLLHHIITTAAVCLNWHRRETLDALIAEVKS